MKKFIYGLNITDDIEPEETNVELEKTESSPPSWEQPKFENKIEENETAEKQPEIESSNESEQLMRSEWLTPEEANLLKTPSQLPENYMEIDIYDFNKTHEENFESGNRRKFIFIEITKDKKFEVVEDDYGYHYESVLTPQCKFVMDLNKFEEFSNFEFTPVDYDSIFGLRLNCFMKYNSNFFTCDERVIFEALLIKFKAFNFKPLYWSKEVIFKEVGIKKDRAYKILNRFEELGIITQEIRTSKVKNRPQQITYFNINSDRVRELVKDIYNERYWEIVDKNLDKYLKPATRTSTSNRLL